MDNFSEVDGVSKWPLPNVSWTSVLFLLQLTLFEGPSLFCRAALDGAGRDEAYGHECLAASCSWELQ